MWLTGRRILFALMLLLAILLSGCVRREGRNSDCDWPEEPGAKTLDPRRSADARHLHQDLELAEELAIRYMDATRSQPGGANKAWNTCFTKLGNQISQAHHVPPKEVAALFDQRSLAIDVAISLPLILIYGLVAGWIAGVVWRRYPVEDGWVAAAMMAMFASLVFGALAVFVGEQWSTFAENLRVGTGHLSYRVDRLPWVRHPLGFFVLCLAVFWSAAAIRYRSRPQ